ncbi:dynamin-binding protein-like isoform X2 [Ornithodoros turicata]|uniref:dynamin-binding protein-like isoform X2 n=1 Tax=Ornithodoros turicata TaxID=34597 RepID=UPI003138DAD0
MRHPRRQQHKYGTLSWAGGGGGAAWTEAWPAAWPAARGYGSVRVCPASRFAAKMSEPASRCGSVASRRSILECDVTAYDLIKEYLRGNHESPVDSDVDDLNVNALVATRSEPQPAKKPPEPVPDYDDDSDAVVDIGRFRDLRVCYSPSPIRRATSRRTASCSPPRQRHRWKTASATPIDPGRRSILKKQNEGEEIEHRPTRRVTFFGGTPDEPRTSVWARRIDDSCTGAWEMLRVPRGPRRLPRPQSSPPPPPPQLPPPQLPLQPPPPLPASRRPSQHIDRIVLEEPLQKLTITSAKRIDEVQPSVTRDNEAINERFTPSPVEAHGSERDHAPDQAAEEKSGQATTVTVTTQSSTGTRVLISLNGRVSGSYPVRRGPAKRRPRMRHSAPQLGGEQARALFSKHTPIQPPPRPEVPAVSPDEPLYADTIPNHYERVSPAEPLYEELPDPKPTEPEKPKVNGHNRVGSDGQISRSFFQGASKADILGYLEDVRDRGLACLDPLHENGYDNTARYDTVEGREADNSDCKELDIPFPLANGHNERCADCNQEVNGEQVCLECEKNRTERREIITEIVQTEAKYGDDLRIVKEELYRPIETAGLLSKAQLAEVFLNLDELIAINEEFTGNLQNALDAATQRGDQDYNTVPIGQLFLNSMASFLKAFEIYCAGQAAASVCLSAHEKDKELLRIFLRVSQMENALLRRMNLAAFLMVPVQRVTKYPLLLSRLHKVTPLGHMDRDALREAQLKVENHLDRINQLTRAGGSATLWRRISSLSARRISNGNGGSVGSVRLRKAALDLLRWSREETRFVMAGRLLLCPVEAGGRAGSGGPSRCTLLHALLAVLGRPNSNYRPDLAHDNSLLFPRNTGIRDGALVLAKEKAGRFILPRDPLYLGGCIISCDPEWKDCFEIQEYTSREGFLFKAESSIETREWLKHLRYHAKDLGSWRRRRNALANIMIHGVDRFPSNGCKVLKNSQPQISSPPIQG